MAAYSEQEWQTRKLRIDARLESLGWTGVPVPPLPPLDEQREIVRRVTRGLILCDRLRESLLRKAFRGELLPCSPAVGPS